MEACTPLGLPFGPSHRPSLRFSLFHIDSQELHLCSLPCTLLEPGLLHLGSRSLAFDSENLTTPLLKLRFNQQVGIEWASAEALYLALQQPPV